jgi:peroxiredoxin
MQQRREWGRWLVFLLGIGFGIALGAIAFLGHSGVGPSSGGFYIGDLPTPGPAPVEGASAPDFSLPDLGGNLYSLHALRGRAVLLYFWTTGCEACRIEFPLLQERYSRYAGQGLAVLGLNAGESEDDVRDFRNELGISFPLLLDPSMEIERMYRIYGYPTSFFINKEGIIRGVHIGAMDEEVLDRYLVSLGIGQ